MQRSTLTRMVARDPFGQMFQDFVPEPDLLPEYHMIASFHHLKADSVSLEFLVRPHKALTTSTNPHTFPLMVIVWTDGSKNRMYRQRVNRTGSTQVMPARWTSFDGFDVSGQHSTKMFFMMYMECSVNSVLAVVRMT